MTCPWYARWWHRRMRKADVMMMLPALQRNLGEGRDFPGGRLLSWQEAWVRFKADAGQEHWTCPCAHADRIYGKIDRP